MGTRKILKNFVMQLFVQNLWNFASEQKPGMTFVLTTRSDKKLVIFPPRTSFNTNPYLASFLSGVLVREWNRKGIAGISSVLETSLAVQGDDLYWRVLRPVALLAGMVLVLLGQPLWGIILFLLGFNFFAQGERLLGYARGLKRGKAALGDVIASLARIKKVLLPLAGGFIGVLFAAMIFNLHPSLSLLPPVQWFIFIPLFIISLVFALLRIPPMLNLLVNLVLIVAFEVLV